MSFEREVKLNFFSKNINHLFLITHPFFKGALSSEAFKPRYCFEVSKNDS
jgi:hypothetical protein